jgi:protein pelota
MRFFKILVESEEDVIWLYYIINQGEHLAARTTRVVKKGNVEEKRKVWVKIMCEKKKMEDSRLRITGPIVDTNDPENVPLHRYHSIDLQPGTTFELWKQTGSTLLQRVIKHSHIKDVNVYVIACDNRRAVLYNVKGLNIYKKAEFEKRTSVEKGEDKAFYHNIIKAVQQLNTPKLLVIGPGFEKEKLKNVLEDRGLVVKTLAAPDIEARDIYNLLKNGKLVPEIREAEVLKAERAWGEFLKYLAQKPSKVAYGEECITLLHNQVVDTLFITTNKLTHLDTINALEQGRPKHVYVLKNNTESGDQLKSLGGVAAILRYEVER